MIVLMYISLFSGFIENFFHKIIGYLHFSFLNSQFVYYYFSVRVVSFILFVRIPCI